MKHIKIQILWFITKFILCFIYIHYIVWGIWLFWRKKNIGFLPLAKNFYHTLNLIKKRCSYTCTNVIKAIVAFNKTCLVEFLTKVFYIYPWRDLDLPRHEYLRLLLPGLLVCAMLSWFPRHFHNMVLNSKSK